ncbi:MAG: Arm DNA-binding domain-containing protein, partial [Desulfovibrio desulfuricans]|nr:Arm DNA-binding domain-containing protein [Desulfovibrio desulfuricans]
MSLTDAAIRAAKPGDKTIKLFDSLGLYLEISPNGGRWWRLKFRYAGKERRISLGVYPTIGLREDRKRRDEAKELLSKNIDPSAHKQAEKEAVKRQQEA